MWDWGLQILKGFVEHGNNFGFIFECIGKPLEIFEPQNERGMIYLVKSDIKIHPQSTPKHSQG